MIYLCCCSYLDWCLTVLGVGVVNFVGRMHPTKLKELYTYEYIEHFRFSLVCAVNHWIHRFDICPQPPLWSTTGSNIATVAATLFYNRLRLRYWSLWHSKGVAVYLPSIGLFPCSNLSNFKTKNYYSLLLLIIPFLHSSCPKTGYLYNSVWLRRSANLLPVIENSLSWAVLFFQEC